MKKILSHFVLALFLIGGFSGCSSPEVITAGIKVEVTGIERRADGTVHVAWQVHNPNVFSYVLRETTHKLRLNDTLVGTLVDKAPFGVPAQSTAGHSSVLIPAKSPATGVIDQAIARGTAAYRLDTVVILVLVDEQVERIPFTNSGTVPVTGK